MNTNTYTLNGANYTFDTETGALLSLEVPKKSPINAPSKFLFLLFLLQFLHFGKTHNATNTH